MTTKTRASRGEIDRMKYEGHDDWYVDNSPEALEMAAEGNAQHQGDHLLGEKARAESEKKTHRLYAGSAKDLEAGSCNESSPTAASKSGCDSHRDASKDTGPKKRQAGGSEPDPRDAQN